MSNTDSKTSKNDAKALKGEVEGLSLAQKRSKEILRLFPNYRKSEIEVFAVLCETHPELMEQITPEEAQRLVQRVHSQQYQEERRQAQTEELLDRSSFNPSRATWWAGKLVDLSLVVAGTALGAVAISKLAQDAALNVSGVDDSGTLANPFSDPSAASPRPARKRDNVLPFDRQAS
jgi:lipid A disaccharide synthetase